MHTLTDEPVKPLFDAQLALYTSASIHAKAVQQFDPIEAVEKLRRLEGSKVIGADYGGDKGAAKLYEVRGGALHVSGDYENYTQGDGGEGYLESLESVAAFAKHENIPVGISWGAPLDGTKPLPHTKMRYFLTELEKKYDGDLANVLPTMRACLNDGPAGVISAAHVAHQHYGASNVLLPINGGGLNMAALKDGIIYSTEAGHVKAIDELNIYGQDKPCDVFGETYVCLESLGANKAGIEVQWQKLRGEYKRAIDIETLFKEYGDTLGGELYEHSAHVVAHVIAGAAQALGMDITDSETVIAAHGGGFKFPAYGDRVEQLLVAHLGAPVQFFMTHTYSEKGSNACIEGAAIAALLT